MTAASPAGATARDVARAAVVLVGVDRTRADVDQLAALHTGRRIGSLPSLPSGAGIVAIATCHRLELYCEGLSAPGALEAFRLFVGGAGEGRESRPPRVGPVAARHLLRVAAGLESAVLGEEQVLSQVRAAYREACSAGRSSPLLHRLFHAAFRAGRRVRAETGLGQGARSLGGAALALLHRTLDGLRDRSVLVLGAGEMAALVARSLTSRGVGRLLIAGRTPTRAAALAGATGAETTPWEWRRSALTAVDAVVCATSAPEPVLGAACLRHVVAGRARPLVVVDMGVPRNVEPPPRAVSGLEVVDIDALQDRLREDRRRREEAVRQAEVIVAEEFAAFEEWASRHGATAVPRAIRAARATGGVSCFRSR